MADGAPLTTKELVHCAESLFADADVKSIEQHKNFAELTGEVIIEDQKINSDALNLKTRPGGKRKISIKKKSVKLEDLKEALDEGDSEKLKNSSSCDSCRLS